MRATPKIDSLLIAHHRERPLEAIVGVGKQSRTERYRERRPCSIQRLTRPQAVRFFINLNGRDVVTERDHLAGQTGFAHLNLFEHAERARDARPDDGAADPGQRCRLRGLWLKVSPATRFGRRVPAASACAKANCVGKVASNRAAPAGSQQSSPRGGRLLRAVKSDSGLLRPLLQNLCREQLMTHWIGRED